MIQIELPADLKKRALTVLAYKPDTGSCVMSLDRWERLGKPKIEFENYAIAMLSEIYPRRYVRKSFDRENCTMDTIEYHWEITPWELPLGRKERRLVQNRMRDLAVVRGYHKGKHGVLTLSVERYYSMYENRTYCHSPEEIETVIELAQHGWSLAGVKRAQKRKAMK